MGVRKWCHRGREKLVLSRVWPDGTRFRRFMPNKTAANELEARISYAVATGSWRELRAELVKGGKESRTDPTLLEFASEYLDYCRARNRDLGFKKQNLAHIKRILGRVRLRDFKRRDADRFADKRLAEGVKPATVNRGLAVLKHMLTVALEREYLETHPLLRYRMLPEPQHDLRVLTYDQYRRLIECVSAEDPVIGAYVTLLGETGLRKREGLRLQWSHIHRVQTGRKIVQVSQTKSGKVRSVPLSPLATEALAGLIRFVDIPFVFVNPVRRCQWKHPREPFQLGKEKAGVEWVGLHGLRHFRATQWLMNGVDVNTVKELLGHSSIQTTMRYVHFLQAHASDVVIQAQQREVDAWRAEKEVDTNWIQSK